MDITVASVGAGFAQLLLAATERVRGIAAVVRKCSMKPRNSHEGWDHAMLSRTREVQVQGISVSIGEAR
jgi:hypothetical protein